MSTTASGTITDTVAKISSNGGLGPAQPVKVVRNKNYKGFVAGIFSGLAKLSGTLALMLCPKVEPS